MISRGKRNVLGVLVDAIDYEAATGQVIAAAQERRPFALTALAVHGVMTGVLYRAHNARLVLVGLGCPRQEVFVYAMRPLLDMPLMAVGAAFDYHAGLLRQPPGWMQRSGLEWLWRLALEPKRLWRRYVVLNPAYLARLG